MTRGPRVVHVQMGQGGGTERFFVALVRAFHEAGAEQMIGLRPDVSYKTEFAGVAEVVEGPFLRLTPGGLWARARWHRAVRAFRPDAVIGWRAPTAKLIPDLPGVAKLVRLGDYPGHVRHLASLDAVVCNNPDIAAHLRSLGHAGRVETISNFARQISPSPMPRARLDTPDDAYVICGSARFAPNKGLDTLIRATARIENAWLWLVGDGAERGALETLVRDQGLAERTRFAGWVAEPMDYIAAADCFVMPSRDEPLGNALIEAWHAGVASVTTATAGPMWYARDGRDCLIVPVDDDAAMAVAIRRLQSEPGLAAELRDGAARTLADRFAPDRVVERYFQLISAL